MLALTTTYGSWSPRKVEIVKATVRFNARENFKAYRKTLRPNMLESWWTDQVAEALQKFYEDLIAGKRPRLAIGAPPQHGKSWAATDFMSWVAGKNLDLKIIFASYSDDLGMRTNLDLQATTAPAGLRSASCCPPQCCRNPTSGSSPRCFSVRRCRLPR